MLQVGTWRPGDTKRPAPGTQLVAVRPDLSSGGLGCVPPPEPASDVGQLPAEAARRPLPAACEPCFVCHLRGCTSSVPHLAGSRPPPSTQLAWGGMGPCHPQGAVLGAAF